MTLAVYVAAPYADAELVRNVHATLAACGMVHTSTWADDADGPEDFAAFMPDDLKAAAVANDACVEAADAIIVLARPGAGGEMFAEARYALSLGKPVFWLGRLTLSAWRDGVLRCADISEAVQAIAERCARD